jgi:hypothetical protein
MHFKISKIHLNSIQKCEAYILLVYRAVICLLYCRNILNMFDLSRKKIDWNVLDGFLGRLLDIF